MPVSVVCCGSGRGCSRPQAYTGLFSGFFGSVYRVFSRFFLVVLWAFCAGFSRLNYDFYLTFAQKNPYFRYV